MDQPTPTPSPRPARRLRWAFALAPLTVVAIVVAIVSLSSTDAESAADVLSQVMFAAFVTTVFGLPIAYAVQAALSFGARRLGRDPSTMSARWVLVVGTAAGAAITVVPSFDFSAVVPGALLGLCAALAFVLIRGNTSAPR